MAEKLSVHLVDGRRAHEFIDPQSAKWLDSGILMVTTKNGDKWSYPVRSVAFTRMTLTDDKAQV